MGRFFSGLGKTIKWFLILGALAIVLVIIAVIIGLGSAADKSQKNSARVTPAVYRQIHVGMRKPALRALVGKPESTDSTTVGGITEECWLYGALADHSYQFCFQNGKLDSKTRI